MANLTSHIFNIAVLIIGAVMFFAAHAIEVGGMLGQGSEIMPILMTSIWIVLAIIITIMGFRKTENFGKVNRMNHMLTTIALLFAFVMLLRPIGFVLTSILYCFVQTILFAPEDKRTKKDFIQYGILSVMFPIIVFNIFANFFSIFLPQGDVVRLPFLFLF